MRMRKRVRSGDVVKTLRPSPLGFGRLHTSQPAHIAKFADAWLAKAFALHGVKDARESRQSQGSRHFCPRLTLALTPPTRIHT